MYSHIAATVTMDTTTNHTSESQLPEAHFSNKFNMVPPFLRILSHGRVNVKYQYVISVEGPVIEYEGREEGWHGG